MGIKKVMAHLDWVHESALREFGAGNNGITQDEVIAMVTVFEAWKAWGVAQIVNSTDYTAEVAEKHLHRDARKYYFSAPIPLTGLADRSIIGLEEGEVHGVLGEPLHGVLQALYEEEDDDNQVG